MAEYVIGSFIRSLAARRFRLVGFNAFYDARGSTLMPQHKVELDKLLAFVSQTTSFSYWLIGYASKVGPADANERLSFNRALSVQKYLASHNAAFADDDRLQMFKGVGETGYHAAERDNSWDWRAVEVHLFIGDVKPPKPPNVQPVPNLLSQLPGGPRFTTWQVAAVFGLQIPTPLSVGPVGIQITANLFGFKKTDGGEEVHWYLGFGPSAGASIPAPKALKNVKIVWDIITSPSYSGLSFSDPVRAEFPITFNELNGADVMIAQAGGGVMIPHPELPFIPTGYQFARMNVMGRFWKREPGGAPTLSHEGDYMLKNVDIGGPQQAVGGGLGGQVNKLMMIK